MTQERKDELLRSALGLIGTHLDEDENVARALSRHLGMTAEEMAECGVVTADSAEESARERLERKVRDCLENAQKEWLALSPNELIGRAEEIASVQWMAKELPSAVSEEDAAYLLRFKDPLQVVSDCWIAENGSDTVIDEELRHVLWSITDRQDMESEYELEGQYCQESGVLSMESLV